MKFGKRILESEIHKMKDGTIYFKSKDSLEERSTSPCFWLGWSKNKIGVNFLRIILIAIDVLIALILFFTEEYIALIFGSLICIGIGILLTYISKIQIESNEIPILEKHHILVKNTIRGSMNWITIVYIFFYLLFNFIKLF